MKWWSPSDHPSITIGLGVWVRLGSIFLLLLTKNNFSLAKIREGVLFEAEEIIINFFKFMSPRETGPTPEEMGIGIEDEGGEPRREEGKKKNLLKPRFWRSGRMERETR